jgi:1-acyl-sn-glycerol-3-phosphate acyltransferase
MLSKIFYSIAKTFLFIIFKILFRFQVFGKNNLPKEGGFIIASNHTSFLDPIVLGLISSRRLNFLAREGLFHNKSFALLISNLGAIPLKEDSKQDIRAFRKAFDILAKKKCLVVFPEGSRSLNGKLQRMHSGVGFLAIRSQCPVVPILIVGTEKALPVKAKFIRPKKITAYVGKILFPPKEFKGHKDFEDFTQVIEGSIRDLEARVKNVNKLKDVTKRNKNF